MEVNISSGIEAEMKRERHLKERNCDAIKQNESELKKNKNSLFSFIVCLNFRAISH